MTTTVGRCQGGLKPLVYIGNRVSQQVNKPNPKTGSGESRLQTNSPSPATNLTAGQELSRWPSPTRVGAAATRRATSSPPASRTSARCTSLNAFPVAGSVGANPPPACDGSPELGNSPEPGTSPELGDSPEADISHRLCTADARGELTDKVLTRTARQPCPGIEHLDPL